METAVLWVPGAGALIRAALAAHVPDPSMFRSGRDLAPWLGLVPRQNSCGGKEMLGGITKQGNPYLRRFLVLGATASLRWLRKRPDLLADWTKRSCSTGLRDLSPSRSPTSWRASPVRS